MIFIQIHVILSPKWFPRPGAHQGQFFWPVLWPMVSTIIGQTFLGVLLRLLRCHYLTVSALQTISVNTLKRRVKISIPGSQLAADNFDNQKKIFLTVCSLLQFAVKRYVIPEILRQIGSQFGNSGESCVITWSHLLLAETPLCLALAGNVTR